MRKLLTGASVLLAAAMMAPMASADTSTVGLHAGNTEFDSGGDIDIIGLNAAWNHDFGNNWTVQASGQVDQLDVGGGELGTGYGSVAAGFRNDNFSVYGYVGLADIITSAELFGLGGQYYLGSFVFGASYGFSDNSTADLDVTALDLNAAWYVTPNLGVSANYNTGEAETTGADADLDGYGVGVVFRLSNSPISFSGRWRHDELDATGFSDEADTWLLGVNLTFGAATAHEDATDGASWDGALLNYERSIGAALF